eukprot:COSAG04_NODE_186_length_21024_cov_6.326069_2_plen_406_part_00
MAAAMAFQWSLAALETLMAEDQMDQHGVVLRAFSVVELWRLRRVCRAFHRWGTAALAAMPRPVVWGGRDNQAPYPQVVMAAEMLDLSTLRWTASGLLPSLPLAPHPLFQGTWPWCIATRICSFADGRVVVTGAGVPDGGTHDDEHGIWSIDDGQGRFVVMPKTAAQLIPGAPGWTPLPHMATERDDAAVVALNDGRTMAIGGKDDDNEEHHATVDLLAADGSRWAAAAPMSKPRCDAVAMVLPCGKVLVAGGVQELSGRPHKTAELWDPATGAWSVLPPMACESQSAAGCVLPSGRAAVLGGYTEHDLRSTDWEAFDLEARAWQPMPPMPRGRAGHSAVPIPGGLVVVGGGGPGAGADGDDWLYDEESARWYDLPHQMAQPRWAPGVVSLPAAALAALPLWWRLD